MIEAEDSTQLIGLATEGIYPRETLHSAMPTAGFAPDAAVDLLREALQPVMCFACVFSVFKRYKMFATRDFHCKIEFVSPVLCNIAYIE